MTYGTLEENIRWAQNSLLKAVKHGFPDEKMGVGDKLILRKVVEKEVIDYLKHDPDASTASYQFILRVNLEMEKYGYKIDLPDKSLRPFIGW